MKPNPVVQLALPLSAKPRPKRGGHRPGAGRKRAQPKARPNVAHRTRPAHKGRFPVHVTLRAGRGVPVLRAELVRNLFKEVLRRQSKRAYATVFQVVHFSIQDDHVHLIVEAVIKSATKAASRDEQDAINAAARDALRRGISGLAISFARLLNRRVGRKGKVWSDRHHRRDLESPSDVRNTILYVLQNYLRHGVRTFGTGVVDVYSSAPWFHGWADPNITIVETTPWVKASARTWLLQIGFERGGGRIRTNERPPRAQQTRWASIVTSYVPDRQ